MDITLAISISACQEKMSDSFYQRIKTSGLWAWAAYSSDEELIALLNL
jgi:hypothetical protein